MLHEVKAPGKYPYDSLMWTSPSPLIFMAGGITNCPDWQSEMAQKLLAGCAKQGRGAILLNPRRDDFDITNPDISTEQIKWEHDALHCADLIMFWFPCETLCPITLYELGTWTNQKEIPVFIGVHPDYKRAFDVKLQTRLKRPAIKIADSLDELSEQILTYLSTHL